MKPEEFLGFLVVAGIWLLLAIGVSSVFNLDWKAWACYLFFVMGFFGGEVYEGWKRK